MKTQFNVRLDRRLAEKVRTDSERTGRSKDDVTDTIFRWFFRTFPTAKRRHFYMTHPPKQAGRKLASRS
jgi:hypothetical protein